MKANKKFLYDYLNAFAPVAQEQEGQKIWTDYIKPFSDFIYTDAYGTSYGVLKSKTRFNTEFPKVVIEAHCDEIAWIITNIEADGMIRVKRHGGSDNMIAPSKTVMIHTHGGKTIKGVFGWPAIHTRKSYTEMGYDQHELWVDTGLKDKEAVNKAGVEVGNLITFDDQFHEMGDYYVGRSLDNKIGGYIIAEAMRKIYEDKIDLPFDLYVVNSVQEEVGLHGAKKIAKHLQADLALVHDVCHNTNTPKIDKSKDGDNKGGEGPCLEYTAQNHRGINKMLREIAADKKIPVQLTVGSMGNDTMAFFMENTPTAILATPLKYMHTTCEMAHKKDVKACIKLFVEFLKALTPDKINEINNR
jgi:putative aminopeptidase FrvX|tara:strand:+ start:1011 stop:2084 length:1074 start_codon:yes stop_codon:yes gene_type:complete